MEISNWISLVGLLLGVASFSGGFYFWFVGSVKKRYAAERDFGHLRKNQEQMSENLAVILKEIEDVAATCNGIARNGEQIEDRTNGIERVLIEQKALMIAFGARIHGEHQ